MWCDKHNMHHAKVRHVATFKIHRATTTTTATNTEDKRGGDDEDLPGGPALFVWPP
eukprot:CAMPEP_0119534932 /NCGR_PEP_ID=MMETSP1344-20130328/48076_1 /TAXON_ID=236787 /ORGANISM="Florenciella parvula, Strain CCMP2471" /LENGTH=55 /DNA_ID=CAMNT_0007576363 /DNA_START=30 /DNA_END=194 /DNA_ORIENTATION=+